MYYRTFVLSCLLVLPISYTEGAPTVDNVRQYLQPLPGYIPVYIRPGDTPLEDINMDLAEAFQSYAYRHYKLNSVSDDSKNALTDRDKKDSSKEKNAFIEDASDKKEISNRIEDQNHIPVVTLYSFDLKQANETGGKSQHIQKIPKA